MIKHLLSFSLVTIPMIANADCSAVGHSMESTLFDNLSSDLKIDTSTIQRDITKVELINESAISELYAKSLARADHEDAIAKGKATIPEADYFSSYYENDVKSITAKYTYINKSGGKDVFIASSLMNSDECSIRFNGYITLSREF